MDRVGTASGKTCTIGGCERAHIARGMCSTHYKRWQSGSSMDTPLRPYSKGSLLERVAAHVRLNAETGCVEWVGALQDGGYGEMNVNGSPKRVSRVVYEEIIGPIPDGLFVLHKCDNPPCVHAGHLFLGTPKDNAQDMLRKGRGANQFGPYPSALKAATA